MSPTTIGYYTVPCPRMDLPIHWGAAGLQLRIAVVRILKLEPGDRIHSPASRYDILP